MNKSVLIVVNSLGLGGGAERIAAEVGSSLKHWGHKVIFLARYDVKQKYDFKGKYRYIHETRNKSTIRKALREFKTPYLIAKICKKEDINTVLTFSDLPNLCAILSKIVFRNESKIIVSVRSNPSKNSSKFQYIIKKLYPRSDLIVALSKGVENELKEDFFLENTTYIHNIQDIKKFERLAEKDILEKHKKLFDNNFIFLNIGSLRKPKGHWYLLRCFKKVHQSKENVKLIVLGGGALKNDLKDLADRLKIKEKVFFLGKVENVFPYLRKSDCFVFTSLWEGFGNVLTEALSQNLPVISTDCVAGPREILAPQIGIDKEIDHPYYGEYGILTKAFEQNMFFKTLEEKPLTDSEEMFADAMIKMYEEEELRKKYSKGLERAKDFDVDKIVDQWEEVI